MANPKRRLIRIGLMAAAALGIGIIALIALPDRKPAPAVPDLAIADSLLQPLPADSSAAVRALRRSRDALQRLKPRKTYIVIDTHANFLELRTADSVLFRAPCSTGSGGELVDSTTGRHWEFRTPHGVFQVQNKLVQPWWRKPDWAFVEEGEPIPKNPADRFDSDVLGDYALGFGDGYFIHGTLYTRLIGINVTHGCVRLADEDLKWLYERAPVGTPIYIF